MSVESLIALPPLQSAALELRQSRLHLPALLALPSPSMPRTRPLEEGTAGTVVYGGLRCDYGRTISCGRN